MRPEVTLLLASLSIVTGLIIPEELPSLLSLLYSNIPPIKKGTDSRVGFGFRLGPHADFQVMLEIGPQTNTAGIGPDASPPSGKRETLQMQNTDVLVKIINTMKIPKPDDLGASLDENDVQTGYSTTEKPPETVAGKWIDTWRNNFFKESYFGKIKFKQIPGIDNRKDNTRRSPAPQKAGYVDQLRQLYRQRSKES